MVPALLNFFAIKKVLANVAVDYGTGGWFATDPGKSPSNAPVIVGKLISTVIGVMTVVAIVYFVFQVIIAGLGMISSEGDRKKIEDARTRMTQGVLGLVIVIVAVSLGSLMARILGLGTDIFNLATVLTKLGLSAP